MRIQNLRDFPQTKLKTFLLSMDFLIICTPVVEALETVDADGENRVEAEVTVVDLEELLVD